MLSIKRDLVNCRLCVYVCVILFEFNDMMQPMLKCAILYTKFVHMNIVTLYETTPGVILQHSVFVIYVVKGTQNTHHTSSSAS